MSRSKRTTLVAICVLAILALSACNSRKVGSSAGVTVSNTSAGVAPTGNQTAGQASGSNKEGPGKSGSVGTAGTE